jgi:hypothetical protein
VRIVVDDLIVNIGHLAVALVVVAVVAAAVLLVVALLLLLLLLLRVLMALVIFLQICMLQFSIQWKMHLIFLLHLYHQL